MPMTMMPLINEGEREKRKKTHQVLVIRNSFQRQQHIKEWLCFGVITVVLSYMRQTYIYKWKITHTEKETAKKS